MESKSAQPGPTTVDRLVDFLHWIAATIAAAAPFYTPLIGLDLFPENIRGKLPNVGATSSFSLTFLVGYALYRRTKQETMRCRLAWIWVPILVVTFFAALAFRLTVSVSWEPDANHEWLVHLVWFFFYTAFFAA